MKSFLRLRFTIVGLTLGSFTTVKTLAADFTFTKIADTTDGFSSFFTAPALNNNGTVAFSGTLGDGSTGIFTGSGGAITPLAVSGGTTPSFLSVLTNPAINNADTVAFGASIDSPKNVGIFTSSGKGLTTIATLNNTALSDSSHAPVTPAINDVGTVAFGAYTVTTTPNPNPPPSGLVAPNVFISNNGNLSAIELKSNVSGAVPTAPNSVAINNANTVVFSSGYGGSLGYGGLFAKAGDTPLLTLQRGGADPASLNNQGTYATAVAGAGGSTAIIIGDSSKGIIGDSSEDSSKRYIFGQSGYDGSIAVRVSNPSINDQDQVVFQAGTLAGSTYPGSQGLFFNAYKDANKTLTTGDSFADANKIIATGDSVFGSTVSSIGEFSTRGLNNSNQVVFYAQLADGRADIVRAEPVPEPPTLIASVLFLLGFGVRTMMKRRL